MPRSIGFRFAVVVAFLAATLPARADPCTGDGHTRPAPTTETLRNVRAAIREYDFRRALIMLREAAAGGSAAAETELGLFYWEGRGGLEPDEREAVRLVRLAADRGYARAQFKLGVFDALGLGGLTKDDGAAAGLYILAAAQGDADAEEFLGVYYENGRGVAKDTARALKWYRKAAAQGCFFARDDVKRLLQKRRHAGRI